MRNWLRAYRDFWYRWTEPTGRSSRCEFWVPVVINGLIYMVLRFLVKTIGIESAVMTYAVGLALVTRVWLWSLVIPTINVYLRRMHDVGASAKFFWLTWIPLAGMVFFWVQALVLCFMSNSYTQHWMVWKDRDEGQIDEHISTDWIWIAGIGLALLSLVVIRWRLKFMQWPEWFLELVIWLNTNWHLNI